MIPIALKNSIKRQLDHWLYFINNLVLKTISRVLRGYVLCTYKDTFWQSNTILRLFGTFEKTAFESHCKFSDSLKFLKYSSIDQFLLENLDFLKKLSPQYVYGCHFIYDAP